jgi:hypothetical protein
MTPTSHESDDSIWHHLPVTANPPFKLELRSLGGVGGSFYYHDFVLDRNKFGADVYFRFEHSPNSTIHQKLSNQICKVAVGVLSNSENFRHRDAIRTTWGQSAKNNNSVQLYFMILNQMAQCSPHCQIRLKRELEFHDDMLLLDSADGSHIKSIDWWR